MHVAAHHHRDRHRDSVSEKRRQDPQALAHDEAAALKIQACWRGSRSRKAAAKRRNRENRQKPWGFYTHTLALTSASTNAGLDLDSPASMRRWVWLLLEEPTSSQSAHALSLLIIGFIVLSIAGFILETVPEMYEASPGAWGALEVACTAVFTIEYLGRLAVCEEGSISQIHFILTPMNLFDLTAVVPFYIELVLAALGAEDTPALRVFRLVRLVRVIRIFKLGRYASGMRLFGEALAGSTTALSVLVFLLCMGVVLFSSALFYVEKLSCPEVEEMSRAEVNVYVAECDDTFHKGVSPTFGLCCTDYSAPLDFPSVIATFWWSLVTMTSVGYGEVYPRTTQGKCVGFFAMLVGMVLIALPVAIVGQKFQDVYDNHDLDEAKRRAAVRMRVMGEAWSLVPASDALGRLKQLRVKDQDLMNSVTDLSSYLGEVWEQREQFMRERKFEFEQQEQIHQRFDRMLSNMEGILDSQMSKNDKGERCFT